MTYEIRIEQTRNYLHATVTGTNCKENVTGYMADIRRECEQCDCFRVLIEERLEGPRLDAMEIFTIASEGSMKALGFFDAVAYVDVHAGQLVDFIETVALNRGMPIAVFSSVEDAKQWLRHHKTEHNEQEIFTRSDKG
jgi:hypothetical protein